jgi:tRNA(Arg) A34 adenosine deaminase TadA
MDPEPKTEAETARWMLRAAIRLAMENIEVSEGGPFGAIVARGREIAATGVNSVVPLRDPTAHAEILAIRAACREAGSPRLEGHVLYSSCRPCPMCLAAAGWAGIDRIYYALTSQDAAKMGFKDLEMHAMFEEPEEERRPPSELLSLPEGSRLVELWMEKPNRRMY